MRLNPQCHRYVLKRQLLKLLGATFRIYEEPTNMLVAVSDQKAFRLKEDIRIYADESRTQETLLIKARQIIDFSAAYDVIDPMAGKLGAFRRKGWSSMVRDEWEVLDQHDRVIGKVIEDSMGLALVRRFLSNLVPQDYDMVMFDGRRVVDLKQNFNPFTYHLVIDFSMDPQHSLDRRMGMAAGVLLAAIEGRQS